MISFDDDERIGASETARAFHQQVQALAGVALDGIDLVPPCGTCGRLGYRITMGGALDLGEAAGLAQAILPSISVDWDDGAATRDALVAAACTVGVDLDAALVGRRVEIAPLTVPQVTLLTRAITASGPPRPTG
ncbi:hypothetical protein [Streptomyces sp. SM12]|uniref:hypothetical protein n=1 Tax=Streptomyces sp. SM12 TaxID=1071602 RepID=UPI000CD578CC|nr:hypothetical protein [Streptomyces sp. SM12]